MCYNRRMEPVTAFFDDSGDLDPSGGKYFCLGMIVVPISQVRSISDAWFSLLGRHITVANTLPSSGVEAKSADIHDLHRRLSRGIELTMQQKNLYRYGLNRVEKANHLIEDVWEFLASPPVSMRYIAVVIDKRRTWNKYRQSYYQAWMELSRLPRTQQPGIKGIRQVLQHFIGRHAFEFLLQRVQHLGDEQNFRFEDAFVIGDESAIHKVMNNMQAEVQAGKRGLNSLPRIVNNVWFGSGAFSV